MSWILRLIIETILNYTVRLVSQYMAEKKRQKELKDKLEKDAAAKTDALQNAKTKEEVDKAVEDMAKDTF